MARLLWQKSCHSFSVGDTRRRQAAHNAIVLVDRVNQLRREHGIAKHAALVEAGTQRLRPILMTSATTIFSLMPMALGLGEGAELRAPLAITVIGGLVVATFLTLIVIPVVYSLVDRKESATDKAEAGALQYATVALDAADLRRQAALLQLRRRRRLHLPALRLGPGHRSRAHILNRIRRVPGVGRVDINGVAPREIFIDLILDKVQEHGVDVGELIAKLRGASSNLVLGEVHDGTQRFTARALGAFHSVDALAELVIDERL